MQALCGDSVDNVPGVPGIGVKTAAELINTYGDLETLLARADEIKQPKRRQSLIDNEGKARLSKELVKLDDDVPLPCPLSACGSSRYDPDKLLPFLEEMELRALKSRIEQRLSDRRRRPRPRAEPSRSSRNCRRSPRRAAYALIDTVEGLITGSRRPMQAGAVAIWPAPSARRRRPRPDVAAASRWRSAPGLAAYVPLGASRAGGGRGGLDCSMRRRRTAIGAAELSPERRSSG